MVDLSVYKSNPMWNIIFLAFAWALTLATSTLLTTVGPLSAKELGASSTMCTMTVGIFLIGAAISSVPSGYLFRKYGRYKVFTMGCTSQIIGSFLCFLAMYTSTKFLIYIGCFLVGLAQGLGQFYRFSAVEITPDNMKTRAVTYVLSGGIIAAFLGPSSATLTKNLFSAEYAGSYFISIIFGLINQFVLFMVNFPSTKSLSAQDELDDNKSDSPKVISSLEKPRRTTFQIVSQPLFILSCTIATLAHTIMVIIMSNVTLIMEDEDFSFFYCSLVLELHFFAMFSPGFLTGKLIEKMGSFLVALLGGVLFAVSSFFLLYDDNLYNYLIGMLLVGVAWNFSFSAGTVMLTSCYEPQEATDVQAVNDFVLFSIAGLLSVISGYIYESLGWDNLIYIVIGFMGVYLLLFVIVILMKMDVSDEIHQPLLTSSPASSPNLQSESSVRKSFTRASFTEFIKDAHRASFTLVNPDDYNPVRTMSVA